MILAVSDGIAILITAWILIDRSKEEHTGIEEIEKGIASGSSISLSSPTTYPHRREISRSKRHSQSLSFNNLSEGQFIDMLTKSDRELMESSFIDLCASISSATNTEQEGLWTPALSKYIAQVDPQDLLNLEWATERHYGTLIRQARNKEELDYLYLIGYARVISLMMKFEEHMGYSLDDLDFILILLEKHIKNKHSSPRILEVGCGTGDLLVNLAECGYQNTFGIDIAPAAIRLAKSKLKEHNLATENILCTSLESFCTSYPDAQFDLIIHCHVIEHLPLEWIKPFLSQIFKCLALNGYMVVITPSKLTGPHDNTRFFRSPGVDPEGLHIQEYSLSELQQLLSSAGFGYFMAMNSLPYANKYWDNLSEENFQAKIRMEPFIENMEWKLRKPLVDGLYFQALACKKLENFTS